MLDIKKNIIVFLIGFFLSFVFGLIGHVDIGVLFLRAFLFGFLFVALAYGLVFLFNKFLMLNGIIETMVTEDTEGTIETESHAVDILVDDELPDTINSPAFEIVNDNQVNKSNESIISSNQESFVAQSIISSENNNTHDVDQEKVETKPQTETVKNRTNSSDLNELDELEQLLPSVDSFTEGDNEDEFSEDEIFGSDTETLGVTMSVGSNSTDSSEISSNAEELAAAVRTMLVNES